MSAQDTSSNTKNDTDEKKDANDNQLIKPQTMVKPHIYFVIDTTGSMSSYIASLNQVLKQVFRMIRILFAGQASIHIIQYKDYCDSTITDECHINDKIESYVRDKLRASGGGDAPEAAKTALNNLYSYMTDANRKNDIPNSIVFVYTDAPPHHSQTHSQANNIQAEKAILRDGVLGFDWINICAQFKRLNIPFYTFVNKGIQKNTKMFWKLLGTLIEMPNTQESSITKATIGMFYFDFFALAFCFLLCDLFCFRFC